MRKIEFRENLHVYPSNRLAEGSYLLDLLSFGWAVVRDCFSFVCNATLSSAGVWVGYANYWLFVGGRRHNAVGESKEEADARG